MATLVLFAACDGDSGSEGGLLTCEWFDSDNCWKASVVAATQCARDPTEMGILNADGRTCTYDDGTEIRFATPIDLNNVIGYQFDLSMIVGGSSCLSYRNPASGNVELTTSIGTYHQQLDGSSMAITCPDGAAFQTAEGQSIFDCGSGVGAPTGHLASWTTDMISIALVGGPDGSLFLFACTRQ